MTPQVPTVHTGKSVAVVGSGPAGLAAAQQLARAGHSVTVFERAEKPGGLLRYGIPEFKMEKSVLDRRLAQMEAEGVTFVCSTAVGGDVGGPVDGARVEPVERGRARRATRASGRRAPPRSGCARRPRCGPSFDALVLAGGATMPRDLPVPGRSLSGVHFAMEYLKPSNLVREGCARVVAHQRQGEAGRHHRGRRHRGRLPGDGAPSGRRVGAPARDHGRAPERPPGRQPLAAVAAHLAHVVRPRGGG